MALTSRISRAVEIIVSLTDKISAPAKKAADSFKKVSSEARKGFRSADKEATKLNKTLERSRNLASSLAGRLSGLFAGVTVGAIVQINSAFSRMSRALTTVIGDVDEASKRFEQIREFARTVPLGVDELTNAFIKLQSRGLEPSIEALESYGNTAAALGKTLDQFVEAIADAVTFQFERLREFGIVASQSAETVSFTFQGVTTTVQKNAAEIEKYLRQIGQVRFAGALTDQMDTIGGAASNLRDSFNDLALAIGEAGLVETTKVAYRGLAAVLNDIAQGIREDTGTIRELFELLNQVLVRTINGIKIAFNGLQVLLDSLKIQFVEFFILVNEQLRSIPFGNIGENAEREVARLKLLNAELKLERDKNLQDIDNAVTRIDTLYKTQAESAERAADRQTRAVDKQSSVIQKYTELLAGLAGQGEKTAAELRTVDLFGPIQDAITALDTGNFDAALAKTDELAKTLKAMGEAGTVSSAELQLVARRVQDLALEATRGKGLGEALVGDEQVMNQRIDELRRQVGLNPITAELQINTAEAEATIEALPDVIPIGIQFVPTNNPNDVIYQESVQRGDNG